MNPSGSTGPEYNDVEKAIVEAGIAMKLDATTIAARLPNRSMHSVYVYARDHYDVRLPTVPAKPKAKKQPKKPPPSPYQIPASGHLGTAIRPDERPQWQQWIDGIFEGTGRWQLKSIEEYAFQAGYEKAQREKGQTDG